jgi:hypothetical protein
MKGEKVRAKEQRKPSNFRASSSPPCPSPIEGEGKTGSNYI